MTTKTILPVVGLLALAACGGGGDPVRSVDLSAGAASFGGLVFETERLTELVNEGGLVAVPVTAQSSDVNYDGTILLVEDVSANPRSYVGQVVLGVGLASGQLNGTANNFFQNQVNGAGLPTGPAFTRGGAITISGDTAVAGTEPFTFAATLGGTFDADGATAGDAVTGTGNAAFRGPNASTIDVVFVDGELTAGSDTFEYAIVTD